MADERLEDLLARLEAEREEADRLYGAALTALDQSLPRAPEMPTPPAPYDERQLAPINLAWDILPGGAPAADRSMQGRLRGFIWRLVGPSLEKQKGFNAALVDHLNRNAVAHREAQHAIATLIDLVRQQTDALVHFQSNLIRYLQTITLYVDTKDRAVAGQAPVLNAALSALTGDWLKRWESLAAREQRFSARVAATDELRGAVALAQQTSLTLKREVERLLQTGAPSTTGATGVTGTAGPTDSPSPTGTLALDAFKYVGFEDAFRGSRDEIRLRLTDYLSRFNGLSDVLDLGCGRGEFLDLLRERGVRARGVDLNHEMVEVSRARGLDVTEGDALGYLMSLPDDSLGGVFAAQVVEHLDPTYLMSVIEAACHKLRAGGLIILETINPACWLAFFESYIRDLTHVRPLHPETLQYLMRASGFHDVEIEYRSPVPESSRLQLTAQPAHGADAVLVDLVDTVNENATKLNARIFTFQDYAAIGRK